MHSLFKRYLSFLTTYLRPQWRNVSFLVCTLSASIGLQLLNPKILSTFIDTASKNGATSSLVREGILFISVALVQQFISIASLYLTTNVTWTARRTAYEQRRNAPSLARRKGGWHLKSRASYFTLFLKCCK